MSSRVCMCCELTFAGETWLADWWAHIRSATHEATAQTERGRELIRAFWDAKDAEAAGRLF